jgi:hypothetical protein
MNNAHQQTAHTESRSYPTVSRLATALIHESHPEYAARVALETQVAIRIAADGRNAAAVRKIVSAFAATVSAEDLEAIPKLAAESRYKSFSSLPRVVEILAGGGDVGDAIILLDELGGQWDKIKGDPAYKAAKRNMQKEFGGIYREENNRNGYTVNEENPWVIAARALGRPLLAGPSGTTNGILAFGARFGLGATDLYRVGLSMHAFFNGMWRGQSGTHRMHEVMAVTQLYCGAGFNYYPSPEEL